jgi:ABC-type Fe3+ transport system substrate-binding protein
MHTRRDVLRLLGLSGAAALVAACSQPAPSAAPTAAPAQASSAATARPAAGDFQAVVGAAKQEGHLVVATYAGTANRKVMDAFEAAYPGIKVEQTGFQSSSRDFFPRFFQERQAGLYQWDLILVPSTEVIVQAVPQNAVDPVRPLIVQPELLQDSTWLDGFESGWLDKGKQYSYAITRSRSQALWIDTNQVKPDEIKSYRDLLDPRWKGKILAGDLRTKGSGYWMGTTLRVKTGSDAIIGQIFKDQQPVLSTDARQLTEQVVRGAYPIGLGAVSKSILIDFLAQGLGKNLKPIPTVEIDYVNSADHVLHYANKAPNPNAAKVFVNWVLSKDGSTVYSKNLEDNSRRADVAAFDPDLVPEKGLDYVRIDADTLIDQILKTQQIAKEVLG